MLKVLTPAAKLDLASLADARLEIPSAAGVADGIISSLIGQASAVIASSCGRTLAAEKVGQTFRQEAHGAESLVLARFPVAQIVAVRVNGTAIDAATVDLDPASGIAYRTGTGASAGRWPCGRIEIDYVAGFILDGETATLPLDLRRACLLLVKDALFSRDRDGSVRSEDIQGVGRFDHQMLTSATLPMEVEAIVSRYRSPRIA